MAGLKDLLARKAELEKKTESLGREQREGAIAEIKALMAMDIHAALGMAVYTGRLDLAELATL